MLTETKRIRSKLENGLTLQNFSFRFIVWELLLHPIQMFLVYELKKLLLSIIRHHSIQVYKGVEV